MRLRPVLPLALSVFLASSTASAGGFFVATDFSVNNGTSYVSAVNEVSPATTPPTYKTALGASVLSATTGAPVKIYALAQMGVLPAEDGQLFGITDVENASTTGLMSVVAIPAPLATAQTVNATLVSTIRIAPSNADSTPNIDGATIDANGNLYVQGRSFDQTTFAETFLLWRFEPDGQLGWKEDAAKLWILEGPASTSLNGGDVAALADGSILWSQTIMADGPGGAPVPRYFRVCGDTDPVAIVGNLVAGNLQAEGLIAGVGNVLAIGDGTGPAGMSGGSLVAQVLWTPGQAMSTAVEDPAFFTNQPVSSFFTYGDLAAPNPTADEDGDGLSDASEGACAPRKLIPTNTVPDYQNPDIDDDCVLDGAELALGMTDPTKPNVNADDNCSPEPNGGAHRVCVKLSGAANAACVKGCRVSLPAAQNGCLDTEECVADADPTVPMGQCQAKAVPTGGAGGEAGQAGAGGETPAGGAGGETPAGGSGGVGGETPAGGAGGEPPAGGSAGAPPAAGSGGASGIGVSEGGGGSAGSSNGNGLGSGTSTGDNEDGCSCAVPGGRRDKSTTGLSILGVFAALGVAVRRRSARGRSI